MPTLKQLTTSGAKRRSRADLTAAMISAPLADFRHTMHIGRGGDAFGDTSFLKAPQELTSPVHQNGLVHPGVRGSRRSQSERNAKAMSCMQTTNNAVSFPYESEDRDLKFHLPQSTSLNLLKRNGRTSRIGGRSLEWEEQRFGDPTELPVFTPSAAKGMKRSESLLSFHIDLGPSMLGDVLSVMEQTEQNLTEGPKQDQKVPCVSNSGVKEKRPQRAPERETCSRVHGVNVSNDDFLFMDEDEDEIRL